MMINRIVCIGFEALLLAGAAAFAFTAAVSHPNLGNITGFGICVVLALGVFFRKPLGECISHMWGTTGGKVILIAAGALIAAALVICTVIFALIAKHADDPPDTPCTVILLGCGMKNGAPSEMMRQRCRAAYNYMEENPGVICIASGGQGDDEPVSEAAMMKDVLIEMGADPDRIVTEDKSTSTWENLVNSKALLDERGLPGEAVIITSEYHQLRASMLAERAGIKAWSVSCRTSPLYLPSCLIREVYGVVYTFLGGK